MAEDLGEKTEQPSSRKLTDARERGQVAKSVDLSGAIDLIGAVVLVFFFGSDMVAALAASTRSLLAGSVPGSGPRLDGLEQLLAYTLSAGVRSAAPIALAMFLVIAVAQVVQVGLVLSPTPLEPKLERLNPLEGAKRLLGPRGLVKTLISIVKLALIATVVVAFISSHLRELASLPALSFIAASAKLGDLLVRMAAWMLLLMLIIGIADWMYQRWQHQRDLRMTKQEVKDERRSMEGDLESKGRRIRMARQMAMQRMRRDVPRADVVVTNPTHFAVALKYEPEKHAAPHVVAKGADFLAFRIREMAIAAGVPIVEKPVLARALYAGVQVGRPVSPEHYEAVAEILAYVYRLAGKTSPVPVDADATPVSVGS